MKIVVDVDLDLVPAEQVPEVERKIRTLFKIVQKFILRELALVDLDHPNQVRVGITMDKEEVSV